MKAKTLARVDISDQQATVPQRSLFSSSPRSLERPHRKKRKCHLVRPYASDLGQTDRCNFV